MIQFLKDKIGFVSPFSDEQFNFPDPIPEAHEMASLETPEEMKERLPNTKYLSERNYNGLYIIPIEKVKVELRFLPQKRLVSDDELESIIDTDFEEFIDTNYEEILKPGFTLPAGTFFRVSNEGVKDKEDYQYYFVEDGKVKTIPNYKTLEVMLAERDKTYSDVKVIEESELTSLLEAAEEGNASGTAIDTSGIEEEAAKKKIEKENKEKAAGGGGGGGSSTEDKSSEWTEDMKEQTTHDSFEELAETAESAEAIAQDAIDEAQKNIDAAVADAEAAEAQAEQAQTEAEAAKAQADADKAQAEKEKAEAEKAKAEADKARAEAEAEKAKLESEQT